MTFQPVNLFCRRANFKKEQVSRCNYRGTGRDLVLPRDTAKATPSNTSQLTGSSCLRNEGPSNRIPSVRRKGNSVSRQIVFPFAEQFTGSRSAPWQKLGNIVPLVGAITRRPLFCRETQIKEEECLFIFLIS